ncbi:EF-hand domain-containing protein [Streptomyces sp. NPDC056402]|uniref:EF-hand domain-containing protein n=1 Tax=Streptomyces sp. NPDC056402 TaxID=3345810 RepID=UPI0035E1CA85
MTLTDAAKRRIFAMLDVDGDGIISRVEYLTKVDRAAEAEAAGREAGHFCGRCRVRRPRGGLVAWMATTTAG